MINLAPSSQQTPVWLRGAVTYGAVPTLFGENPLQDLTDRLDDLQQMGVDAVWISPIQETDDPSDISYATTDFEAIRPDFGTAEDLKMLVSEAHARDIKVLLDIAPNHVSEGHHAYEHAEAHGERSPFYSHFDRDAEGNVTNYFDWEHLKNLNFEEPRVQAMISSAFHHWVEEFGVDGFRVDAAWGPRERTPEFWGKLNEELRQSKPDVFLLAEAGARDAYYSQHGFDAAYDWGDTLGVPAWSGVFDDETTLGQKLHQAIEASPKHQVARFLNNNDTGERFITTHGPEKTRVAATLLLTLPGLPVVYAGDEVGAEFLPYDDPPPLDWTDPHRLKAHYRLLADLRERVPSLAEGDYRALAPHGAAFGFLRQSEGQPEVAVVLNFGAKTERLSPPPGLYRNLLDDRIVEVSIDGLPLEPHQSMVLERLG